MARVGFPSVAGVRGTNRTVGQTTYMPCCLSIVPGLTRNAAHLWLHKYASIFASNHRCRRRDGRRVSRYQVGFAEVGPCAPSRNPRRKSRRRKILGAQRVGISRPSTETEPVVANGRIPLSCSLWCRAKVFCSKSAEEGADQPCPCLPLITAAAQPVGKNKRGGASMFFLFKLAYSRYENRYAQFSSEIIRTFLATTRSAARSKLARPEAPSTLPSAAISQKPGRLGDGIKAHCLDHGRESAGDAKGVHRAPSVDIRK